MIPPPTNNNFRIMPDGNIIVRDFDACSTTPTHHAHLDDFNII